MINTLIGKGFLLVGAGLLGLSLSVVELVLLVLDGGADGGGARTFES